MGPPELEHEEGITTYGLFDWPCLLIVGALGAAVLFAPDEDDARRDGSSAKCGPTSAQARLGRYEEVPRTPRAPRPCPSASPPSR